MLRLIAVAPREDRVEVRLTDLSAENPFEVKTSESIGVEYLRP
jgi:hypothetical protein